MAAHPAPTRELLRHPAAVAGALALGTFALYAQVGTHAFLQYDDDLYVTANAAVRAGLTWSGVRWAFTSLDAFGWQPLTWLSHMLDVQLFGLDAGAHHLVNAAIHAANAALLFAVLAHLTGATARSAVVAALFAVHPLHVESVAWLAERKDLLSTAFGFLALAAYARYVARPSAARYACVVAALAASLAAKPMWVTAPFLLLLLDVWPLRRFRDGRAGALRLVLEKVPLVALVAASSAVAVVAQARGGAVTSLDRLDLASRVANVTVAYVRYLGKTVWPSDLAAFYPMPEGGPGLLAVAGSAAVLLALTGAALAAVRAMPWIAVGWLWFLGMLVPVIGLVQLGSQAMADRYTYVPAVGVFVGVVWTLAEVGARRVAVRHAGTAAAAVTITALAGLTVRQAPLWRDQETLFRHTLAVTGPNPRAHHILSQALGEKGAYPEAVVHAAIAAQLDPANPRTHKNLGYLLYRAGRVDEAIAALERAVALQPDYAEAHANLAIAYGRKGWVDRAAREMTLGRPPPAAR
jgi:hypothetical protein